MNQLSLSSGVVRRVLSPHISFLSRQTNTESSFSHGQTVIFDTLYENLGHGYNPHNGIFRAPVAGLYIVLLTVASDGTRSPDVEVVLDGSVLCRVVTTLYWVGSSCNIIVHFNEGDNVWARIEYDYAESRIRGAFFSTFSIGLLSPD
ncbi:hypothetical protein ACJMK2_023735 [Sinanodonta woodiana]|uniref:C1q domain-containing protein n=1 Tax=Sinanodonta woodiana TaxID=1069815 RepID=A0ABD3T566_SINWO